VNNSPAWLEDVDAALEDVDAASRLRPFSAEQ
jgi:hypothetical protein